MKVFLSICFVLVILLAVSLVATILGLTAYGIYLAFSASVVIGICALLLEPSPLIIAIIYLAFDYNIPEHVLAALTK